MKLLFRILMSASIQENNTENNKKTESLSDITIQVNSSTANMGRALLTECRKTDHGETSFAQRYEFPFIGLAEENLFKDGIW